MLFNEMAQSISDASKLIPDAVGVNCEIIILWLNIILIFRTQALGKVYCGQTLIRRIIDFR